MLQRAVDRCAYTIALIGFMLPAAHAQFSPYVRSVANSASYSPVIAQGSIFTVFGSDLGPVQLQQATEYPLPSQLAGTSIKISSGGATLACPIFFVSFNQVAAILPSSTPTGQTQAVITAGGRSVVFPIEVTASRFGGYTVSESGLGPGIVTGLDYKVKTFSQAARPGETLILWGTGLGPIKGNDATVPAGQDPFQNVDVYVGNEPAMVTYAGRSGCCAGLDQIAFQVPQSAPAGCFVPVAIRTTGATVSNFVTLPIADEGRCSNSVPGLPSSVIERALAGETLKFAAMAIGPIPVLQGAGFPFSQGAADRLSLLLGKQVSEADVRQLIKAYVLKQRSMAGRVLAKYGIDPKHVSHNLARTLRTVIGLDQQGVGATFGAARALSDFSPQFAANFTSVGTCTVTSRLAVPTSQARSKPSDAGAALTFRGPLGTRGMQRVSTGQYQAALGSGYANASVPVGAYSISGTGGVDVGAFSASLNIVSPLTWTNKPAIAIIDRSRPLTVTWSGGPAPGYVLIGASVHTTGMNTAFLCVEDALKGSFTIPAFVLSALPPAGRGSAYMFIGPHPFTHPVSIPGVDLAYFADGSSDYTTVAVK